MGNMPTEVDCTLFAFVALMKYTPLTPDDNYEYGSKQLCHQFPTLSKYSDQIESLYYPDWDRILPQYIVISGVRVVSPTSTRTIITLPVFQDLTLNTILQLKSTQTRTGIHHLSQVYDFLFICQGNITTEKEIVRQWLNTALRAEVSLPSHFITSSILLHLEDSTVLR